LFFKKKNPAVPFLLTLQEGDPLEYIKKRVGIFSSWFSQIFAQADYIQAISNFLAVWAKKMGARCPVEVVPNGVDLKLFFAEIPSQELEGLKEKTDKGEKDKFLIHTGRLIKKNGLINVVSSLRFLPDYVKFLVVGNGPDQQKLKHLSEDLKVRERVIFAGELSHSEMAKYLKISDIFIRPSLSEGLGNSFLEAMAAGVPIIGTSVGGIPDFLGDGETGLFCEIENPENIAQKILLLLGNENLRQKLIMNGKKLVEEKYEWNKIAARMEAIMKQLTA